MDSGASRAPSVIPSDAGIRQGGLRQIRNWHSLGIAFVRGVSRDVCEE